MKYIHYGCEAFQRERFNPIQNHRYLKMKPVGGLWASPVDAERSWREWCEDEDYHTEKLDTYFEFELAPSAKILRIDSLDKIPPKDRQRPDDVKFPSFLGFDLAWCYLNFEELMNLDGYDAIEIVISKDWRLYHTFYGWDCDSILIMNPDIIVPC